MAADSIRTPELTIQTSFSSSDQVVGNYSNGTANITSLITLANVFGNTDGLTCIYISESSTPANSTANGSAGTITWDSSYVYVCVADNTWKRAALETW